MKLKTLFIINSIVAIVFGVVFVLIPSKVLSLYGHGTGDVLGILNYMGQLLGAALIGFGLISWRARNAESSESVSAIVFGFFVADTVGFIVALIGQLNNVVNVFGWTTVLIYLLLAIGFGYFTFQKVDKK